MNREDWVFVTDFNFLANANKWKKAIVITSLSLVPKKELSRFETALFLRFYPKRTGLAREKKKSLTRENVRT